MKNNLQETKLLINPESDIVPAKGFQPNENEAELDQFTPPTSSANIVNGQPLT